MHCSFQSISAGERTPRWVMLMFLFCKLVGFVFVLSILAVVGGFLLNACVMNLNGGFCRYLVTNSAADQAFWQRGVKDDGPDGAVADHAALATPQTKMLWAVDRFRHTEMVYDDNDRPLGEQVAGMASIGDIVAIYGLGYNFPLLSRGSVLSLRKFVVGVRTATSNVVIAGLPNGSP